MSEWFHVNKYGEGKMGKKMYYCKKCNHKHKYNSKIGKQHLQFKENISTTPVIPQPKPDKVKSLDKKTPEHTGNRFTRFVQEYWESYRNGVVKYGVWWKIFQISIWGFVFIFLLTAAIIFVIFLPKIETIYLNLH